MLESRARIWREIRSTESRVRHGLRPGVWIALLLVGLFAPESQAGEGKPARTITATAGVSYTSGDYGDRADARILYIPLSLKYQRGRWTTKVTVPFVQIQERRTRRNRSTVESMERGLGDIVTSVSYRFAPWSDRAPSIRLTGKLKLPTAEDGLGAREIDYTGQIQLSKTYDRFTPYVELGYRVRGSASGGDVGNRALASLGFSYELDSSVNLGLAYDFRQRSRSGLDDARELVPYGSFALSKATRLGLYGVLGLSDSSPDLGAGLSLSHRFD